MSREAHEDRRHHYIPIAEGTSTYVRQYIEYLQRCQAPYHQCPACGIWHQRRLECPFCYAKQSQEKEK